MLEKYITEGKIYLITNKAVARTSIFGSQHYCERFLYQLRRYLGPLGEILAYSLVEDEFSVVMRMGDRAAFEHYYKGRQCYEGRGIGDIPESTYIFSDAVANLLSSTAKHFNIREERAGALFASRFKKFRLIDSGALKQALEGMWRAVQFRLYRRRWRDRNFDRSLVRKSWCFNFRALLEELGDGAVWKRWQEGKMKPSWFLEVWGAKFKADFQGRLKNTYFFPKIPFNLPFIKPTQPP